MTSKDKRIQPRTLKGFRDYLPQAMLAREDLIAKARSVYRSYGFSPIDTPALEYEEILTGKGGEESDKQMYRFTDNGGRQVAMRFDLTIPLARFAAQHIGELGKPFKRYHIGPVWRGENTQRGRYREFMQCDFDTIGTEDVSADVETALVIHDLLQTIDAGEFQIHMNNRLVLTGMLERLDLLECQVPVLRALDKLAKIGPDKVVDEMVRVAGASETQAREVLKLAAVGGDCESVLGELAPLVGGSEQGERGLERLTQLVECLRAVDIAPERYSIDLSIARGLDYYTGAIFETFLADLPGIGSVCSGGRYDDLAALYTKEQLPGIGASLGLDRLLAALEELGRVEVRSTPANVFVTRFSKGRLTDYLELCGALRRAGFDVELYPEERKLGPQLKHADRRGYRCAVILGDDEWTGSKCLLKDLQTGKSEELALSSDLGALIEALNSLLGPT